MLAVSLAVFAMAVSKILVLEPVFALIGALLPLSSQFFHSLPIALAISAFLCLLTGKRKGISFLVGWLASTAIISLSGPVSLFAPGSEYSFGLFSDDFGLNIFVFAVGLILYSNYRKVSDWLSSFQPQTIRKAVFLPFFALFVALSLSPVMPISVCQALEAGNETKVVVSGRVCSSVDSIYNYNVFHLCSHNCTIQVWSQIPADFLYNDNITVSGVYTEKYREPEIYRILWLRKN